MFKNNSLWASKTVNSGRTESVICDPGRSGVFGQPALRALRSLDAKAFRCPMRCCWSAPDRCQRAPGEQSGLRAFGEDLRVAGCSSWR